MDGSGSLPDNYVSVSAPNVFVETLKRAEDGQGYVIRLYEASGRLTDATVGIAGIRFCRETDMLENTVKELPVKDGAVSVRFRPYEIITLRFN